MKRIKLDVVTEIRKIREELYEEEKDLNATERVAKIRREANAVVKKYGLKLKRRRIKPVFDKEVVDMPITRDFKEAIQARASKDKSFREGFLRASVECLLADDLATGKALLRDYINATIGFEELAKQTYMSR